MADVSKLDEAYSEYGKATAQFKILQNRIVRLEQIIGQLTAETGAPNVEERRDKKPKD